MPPPSPPHHSRRDLIELKSLIARKLGPERAQRYFGYLNRLLAQKLSKSEFDKLCFRTLGRENIPLHNQFIRLVLRHACLAKVPPPAIHDKYTLKASKAGGKKSPSTDDWLHPSPTSVSATSVLSNGEILSPSPCKSRYTNHRIKDQCSALGSNGKTVIHQLRVQSDEVVVGGKCDLTASDLKTSVQHQKGGVVELSTNKERVEKLLPHDQVAVHSKGPPKVVEEDEEELALTECAQSRGGPICAPLGIPFCPVSIGGACRPVPISTNHDGFASNCYSGELYHTEVLRKCMEQIAGTQNLGGVTMECANLLNNGLDVYLKRLIKSCVDLVGSRSRHEPIKQPLTEQQSRGKIFNGIWQGNNIHMQIQEPKKHHRISLLDFRVAMELNPGQLGEYWPLLLEKVSIHSFEE